MKATLAGLALSTAVFAAQAEPPAVDTDAQTITWQLKGSSRELATKQTLNCRFGIFTSVASGVAGSLSGGYGVSTSLPVDLVAPGHNSTRAENARKTCKDNGLTPGF